MDKISAGKIYALSDINQICTSRQQSGISWKGEEVFEMETRENNVIIPNKGLQSVCEQTMHHGELQKKRKREKRNMKETLLKG